MSRTITIDPITRIEGHARITLSLDERGYVDDAQFHVTQFRGFEKFCEGRPFYEMPSLMARICGICPVSHLIASSKACDALLAVRVPPAGAKLRAVMNLAQIFQSHALSFFHLSSPDFLLGMDADPASRNIFGALADHGDRVRDGVRLRAFGQQIIEDLGGKRIHPAWVVPGGVSSPLRAEVRQRILAELPDIENRVRRTLDWFKIHMRQFIEEIRSFANFPTLFMGLVDEDGHLEHYDGTIRFVDADGHRVGEDVAPEDYRDVVAEQTESHSFLKSTYYRPLGYAEGTYRVGPLARLNVADRCGTPLADQELSEFRDISRGAVSSSFYYHEARLIEMLYCLERLRRLLDDPDISSRHVRAHAEPNAFEGVGVSEAPRGTLMHRYRIDENGLITTADLVIATGHNNLAMNRGILQVARHFIGDGEVTEGALNRVEAVIRCFDPCLSCSTHAMGQMPIEITVVEADGRVRDVVRRFA